MESSVSPSENKPFNGLWFKSAIVFQILTSLAHSLSFFARPQPANDTEKQMLDLMMNYENEMGNGFTPTMFNILTSFSASFALLYFFGALMNWHLWRADKDRMVLKGALIIQVLIYGIMFAVSLFLTFLPPILFTGIVFILLLIAWLTWPTTASRGA